MRSRMSFPEDGLFFKSDDGVRDIIIVNAGDGLGVEIAAARIMAVSYI